MPLPLGILMAVIAAYAIFTGDFVPVPAIGRYP